MERGYTEKTGDRRQINKQRRTNSVPKKTYSSTGSAPKKVPTKRRRKSNIVKGIALLIVAGILIMILILPMGDYFPHLWGGPVYPERAKFTIERTITLSVQREVNYNVTVPFPEDIPGNDMQKIHELRWNEEPDTFSKYGIDWKSWRGTLDGESKEIVINYDVETSTVIWRFDRDESGTVDQIDAEMIDRYSGNNWQLDEDRNRDGELDWMIQPDHPEIRSLAEDVTRGENTLYGKARSIYDWMQNNLEYERGAPGELPKHSIWTLETRSGDCDEWSFLYISMARAVGIPAWIELGVLYDRILDEWGGHGWVRLQYVSKEGESGWVNIDTVNRQFFARDTMRITTWVDDGTEGNLNDYYHYVSYNYTGGDPRFRVSDEYRNVEMETEGEVFVGDGFDIPWPGIGTMLPVIGTAFLIYTFKKGIPEKDE